MNRPRYIINQTENQEIDLLINGEIDDWWGVGLNEVRSQILNSGASKINLQINSPGGSVTEGLAIAAFIKNFPATINTSIIGLAASIATPIALAGNEVSIDRDSFFMIHNPWTVTGGEADDLRETADLLDKMRDQLAKIYLAKITDSGKLVNGRKDSTMNQILKWMNSETWFTAQEAFDAGLVDKIMSEHKKIKRHTEEDKATAASVFNKIKTFSNTPLSLLNQIKEMSETSINNGANLGSFLSEAIDDMVTDELSRADIIEDMAQAAGISRDTTLGIIAGDVHCPPINRLEGFAEVLDATLDQMITAAEGDSCEYAVDKLTNNMNKNEKEEDNGFFDTLKSFFISNPKEVKDLIDGLEEGVLTAEEDEIAKAKELLESKGTFKIEEIKEEETEEVVEETTEEEPSELETIKAEMKALKEANEEQALKLQKIEEEKNAGPSAGAEKPNAKTDDKKTIEQLYAPTAEHKEALNAFSKIFN